MAAKELDREGETSKKVLMSELSQPDVESCRTGPDGRESERQYTDRPLKQKQGRRTLKKPMAATALSDDESHLDLGLRSGDLALFLS